MTATKKLYRLQIVIEKEPEADYFTAYSPSLAGCFRRGKTIEEAREGVRQVLEQRLEVLVAGGEPVLQRERLLHVEELTIVVGERAGSGAKGDPDAV